MTTQIVKEISYKNGLYTSMIKSIETKDWSVAKNNLEELGEYKDCNKYVTEINYNYYLSKGDSEYSNKNYEEALTQYNNAKSYSNANQDLKNKIALTQKAIEKQKEEIKQAKLKAEREEKLKTQKMINNVVILSQEFGYTQYGEEGVVGRIKNKNSFPIDIRADIDLKDSRGNIVGTTYTYDRIAPNSVWNFEAPFLHLSAQPNHMYLNLTIDKVQ
jgi:hypothetical protein